MLNVNITMHKVMTHVVLYLYLMQIFNEKFLVAFFDDIPKTTSFYCQFLRHGAFPLSVRCFYLKRGIKKEREKEEG